MIQYAHLVRLEAQSCLFAISPMQQNADAGLTENKSKHVRKRPRRIVDDMKLACLEQGVPNARSRSKGFLDAPAECNKRESITQAQHSSDYRNISNKNTRSVLNVYQEVAYVLHCPRNQRAVATSHSGSTRLRKSAAHSLGTRHDRSWRIEIDQRCFLECRESRYRGWLGC